MPERVTLIWRAWPDEAEEVVFNAASGQIHLLDVLSAAALREIAERSATVAEIADRLGAEIDVGGADLVHRLSATCDQLDQIGLIEPSPS